MVALAIIRWGFRDIEARSKKRWNMKIRILVIDDEPRWVEFAKNDLSKFEIIVAPDKKTALAELEANQFELVIASSRRLDILEIIRKKYADKRVVVATVRPTTNEALAAYRLGAVRYIPKSFDPRDLFERVREVLSPSAGTG
jgi:DNA-binding response OmpR family regulator